MHKEWISTHIISRQRHDHQFAAALYTVYHLQLICLTLILFLIETCYQTLTRLKGSTKKAGTLSFTFLLKKFLVSHTGTSHHACSCTYSIIILCAVKKNIHTYIYIYIYIYTHIYIHTYIYLLRGYPPRCHQPPFVCLLHIVPSQ